MKERKGDRDFTVELVLVQEQVVERVADETEGLRYHAGELIAPQTYRDKHPLVFAQAVGDRSTQAICVLELSSE